MCRLLTIIIHSWFLHVMVLWYFILYVRYSINLLAKAKKRLKILACRDFVSSLHNFFLLIAIGMAQQVSTSDHLE